jgi:hypothetical protein
MLLLHFFFFNLNLYSTCVHLGTEVVGVLTVPYMAKAIHFVVSYGFGPYCNTAVLRCLRPLTSMVIGTAITMANIMGQTVVW